jgi:hypothetical protein
MRRRTKTITAGLAFTLLTATAWAGTIRTKDLDVPPGGMLVCTVLNLTEAPLDIAPAIVSHDQGIRTDFVATSWQDEIALIPDTVVLESMASDACHCIVGLQGGRRRDVRVLLEAFDADGVRTAFVGGR